VLNDVIGMKVRRNKSKGKQIITIENQERNWKEENNDLPKMKRNDGI
jgi:hypothetical protein